MTQEEINAIRARADKATPGPWVRRFGTLEEWSRDKDSFQNIESCILITESPAAFVTTAKANAPVRASDDRVDMEFIAHARADIPRLLDEIDRLKAELREAAETGLVDNKWREGWDELPPGALTDYDEASKALIQEARDKEDARRRAAMKPTTFGGIE